MKKNNSIKNDSEFSREEKLAIINQYLLKRYEVTEEMSFMDTSYVVHDTVNNRNYTIDKSTV